MADFQCAMAAIARAGSSSLSWIALLAVAPLRDFISRVSAARAPTDTYYVNPSVQAVARLSDGVRLPSGEWTRIGRNEMSTSYVESVVRRLFPALGDATLYVFTLNTELDVDDFERCFGLTRTP